LTYLERRNSFINQFVDDTLSSQPIQWLLRKLSSEEEESTRHQELRKIYQIAADKSSAQATMRGHFEFHGQRSLPKTFHETSERMQTHDLHFLSRGSTRLDGGRVLIVVHPEIERSWMNESARYGHETSSKAYVVVGAPEAPEDPEDEKEWAGKDEDRLSR
jgi:hypothetical protein